MRKSSWSPDLIDRFCLFLIILLSASPYLPGLGFYSDDWAVLAYYGPRVSQSAFAFIDTGLFYPSAARPLQGIWFALLFKWFGTSALPYHLTNLVVLALSGVLLLMLARSLGATRRIGFALALSTC